MGWAVAACAGVVAVAFFCYRLYTRIKEIENIQRWQVKQVTNLLSNISYTVEPLPKDEDTNIFD
jgi:hypothetical protein